MDYKQKYLKYKAKYFKLVEELIGGTKTLEEIEKEVSTCIKSKKSDEEIKNCIEQSGKDFILTKINSNSHLKCHVKKGSQGKYHILKGDSNTCELLPTAINSSPEFNWHNYKEHFDDSQKAIVYAFRTELVDDLIKFIFDNYPQCSGSTCKSIPSGSTGPEATLNSDYDLTLSGNYKISSIIQMFNSIFEHEFRSTSAEIFDTNLYGYSFLISKAGVKSNPLWTPVLEPKSSIGSVLGSKPNDLQGLIIKEKNISTEQDKWAYLRIKSFYEKEKSNTDLAAVLTGVAHSAHDGFFFSNNINTMKEKDKQTNYLNQMISFETQMATPQTKEKMINTLSNMNYFGDETYFTQGAFVHVVGLMYFKTENETNKKSLFSKNYYLIHSMAENFAYFIHAFYSHHNDIIYAIKYFYRFINALFWLEKLEGKNTKGLADLNDFTDWIKSKIRNRSEEEVFEYLRKNSSEMAKYGMPGINKCDGADLASITQKIKEKLKTDISKFVENYTGEGITEKGSCKFYLIAQLEILRKVIDNNPSLTSLKIERKSVGKFTISCN